jgi:ribonuclease BN (tRNA processing enzyme)
VLLPPWTAKVAAPAFTHTQNRIETVSWSPRAYIFHNFLSHAEADHIVELVEGSVSTTPPGGRGRGDRGCEGW